MDGNYRLRPWRDSGRYLSGIQTPSVPQNINKNRRGAKIHNRGARCDPVGIGKNDLVTRTYPHRCHAKMQCPGTARRCYGELGSDVARKGFLEAMEVVVAAWTPTIRRRVSGIVDFTLSD